jgi:hypothetical protein
MFIKLLATRSVANSFFGFSKRLAIIFPFEVFSWMVLSMSFCDNEKKAISAPETMAEQNSRANIPTKPNVRVVSKVYAEIILGSGSKLKEIS